MARTLPLIDPARCTGCGRCVAACPPHVLSLEARGWVKTSTLHDASGCTGCRACEAACPFNAITTPFLNSGRTLYAALTASTGQGTDNKMS